MSSFESWMRQKGLSESSAKKYSGAVTGPLTAWANLNSILSGPLTAVKNLSTFQPISSANTMIGWHKKKGGSASQALKAFNVAQEALDSCGFSADAAAGVVGTVMVAQRKSSLSACGNQLDAMTWADQDLLNGRCLIAEDC